MSTDNSSNTSLFFKIAKDQLFERDFDLDHLIGFGTYVRMNHGQLVSKVLQRVPKEQDYTNGRTLVRAVGGAFLPRIIWPGKPNFGGEENMRVFLGHKGKLMLSENIGPYGEGYGNFGKVGGIIYSFVFGIFLSFLLHKILVICRKKPTLLLFLPFIFLKALSVETDLLTTLGSLWTAIIFVWFLYWFSDKVLGVSL